MTPAITVKQSINYTKMGPVCFRRYIKIKPSHVHVLDCVSREISKTGTRRSLRKHPMCNNGRPSLSLC